MAEPKHTPGPWGAAGQMKDEYGLVCIEVGAETPAGHMSVAWVMLGKTPTPLAVNEGMADARLLAAAPELLEALRALAALAPFAGDEVDTRAFYHLAGFAPLTWGDVRRAAAAIAKAEGRAP